MTHRSPSISRIALLGCDERTQAQIQKTTNRMGLICQNYEDDNAPNDMDVLVVDVAHYFRQDTFTSSWDPALPVLGLLAHGSPTEIEKSLKLGATAVMHKPINQMGLYAALIMAQRLKREQASLIKERDDLLDKHQKRHLVIKATTVIMQHYSVDSDSALSMLRAISMKKNQSLEELSQEVIMQLPDQMHLYR